MGTCHSLPQSPSSEIWARKAPSPPSSPLRKAPPSLPSSPQPIPSSLQQHRLSRRGNSGTDTDSQELSIRPPHRVNSVRPRHQSSPVEDEAQIKPAPPDNDLQYVIEDLERLALDKDYVEFFNAWSNNLESSQVVQSACGFLRSSVEQANQENPNGVILAGNAWVKPFTQSMDRHREEAVTVNEILSTILVLCQVRKSYRKNMTKSGLVESVLKASALYEQASQPWPGPKFCEFFQIISRDEKEGLNINHKSVLKVIQSIAEYLRPNHEGREYAIQVLYNFVCHKRQSEETQNDLKHDVARCLTKSDTAHFLREILEGTTEETTAVAAVGIWYRLSSIHQHIVGPSEGISATACVWQNFQSESLSTEICGFFSNLVLSPTFPVECVGRVYSLVCQCMHTYPSGTTVQLYGMRSLCRILEEAVFQDQVFGDVNMLVEVLRLVHDAVLHLLDNCDNSLAKIVHEIEPLSRVSRLALELSRSGIVGRLELGSQMKSQMQRLKEPTKESLDIILVKCYAAEEDHDKALVLNSATPELYGGSTERRKNERAARLVERMHFLVGNGEFLLFFDILESNGADLEVAHSGLDLIRTMIGILDLETLRWIGVPLTSMLICLFHSHVGNVSLLVSILEIVRELCRRDEHITSLLLQADRFAFIIQSVESHISSFEVQIESIRLMNILSVMEDSQIVIGRSGGCATMITAMHVHQESAKLQTLAIGTLRNLTALSFNREMIQQAEGERAIVGAIVVHNMDALLISSAFMALNDLIVNMDDQKVAQMRNESLDAILVAMQTFPHDESVQSSACILLKSIAYESQNLQKLLKRKENLKQMLERVALEFPETCGERACVVIKKISKDAPRDCGERTSGQAMTKGIKL